MKASLRKQTRALPELPTQPPEMSPMKRDPCADHCPQELDHKFFFTRGLPAPCGCKPA